MSKLDSFIRRMSAQRDCIDEACKMISAVPGVVFELGLGSGRTYSHLVERLPDRDIYVFDRAVLRHAVSIPPDDRLVLGDLEDTLPRLVQRFEGQVALVHTDIGAADREYTDELAAFVATALAPALAPGALVLSDQALRLANARDIALPDGVAPGRYHMYRAGPGAAA